MFLAFGLSSCSSDEVIQGEKGNPGIDGTSLLSRRGSPSNNLGKVGDSYIDLDTWDFYIKTNNGWNLEGNIKGTVEDDYIGTEGLEFYPLNDTECAVSVGKARYMNEIIIPSKYKNYTVTTIDKGGTEYNTGFSECYDLEKIILPDTVTTISDFAFAYCINLKEIRLPDSITSIGEGAFLNCNELKYNEYDNGIYIGSVNNPYFIFYGAKNTEIATCEINKNTKIIYPYAFAYCSEIKNITIPEGVKIINRGTFYECSFLEYVKIPNSITVIFDKAFYNCDSLMDIVINKNIIYIGQEVFTNCDSLTIYCELSSDKLDWHLFWKEHIPIYWVGEWEYDSDGNPISLNDK